MAIEGIAVLQLHQHGVANGGIEEAEWELWRVTLVACYVSLTSASFCNVEDIYHDYKLCAFELLII
jgi:hypothetical protein